MGPAATPAQAGVSRGMTVLGRVAVGYPGYIDQVGPTSKVDPTSC